MHPLQGANCGRGASDAGSLQCPPAKVRSLHTVLAAGALLPFGVWVSSHTFAVLLLLVIVVGDNWRPISVVFPWRESIHCMLWALV